MRRSTAVKMPFLRRSLAGTIAFAAPLPGRDDCLRRSVLRQEHIVFCTNIIPQKRMLFVYTLIGKPGIVGVPYLPYKLGVVEVRNCGGLSRYRGRCFRRKPVTKWAFSID